MDNELADIKPLVEIPWEPSAWFYLGLGLATFVLAAAGYWLWTRYKARTKPTLAPDPADVIALRELAVLREQDLGEYSARQQCCFTMSLVLRAYIEAVFQVNATDLTSVELIRLLGKERRPGVDACSSLEEILKRADGVKFGKQPIEPEELRKLVSRAQQWIRSNPPLASQQLGAPS